MARTRCAGGRRTASCWARKTRGGTRYYAIADLLGLTSEDAPTVAYARVSSHDQKADLKRQQAALEAHCAAKGWRFEIICDLGSGLNCRYFKTSACQHQEPAPSCHPLPRIREHQPVKKVDIVSRIADELDINQDEGRRRCERHS